MEEEIDGRNSVASSASANEVLPPIGTVHRETVAADAIKGKTQSKRNVFSNLLAQYKIKPTDKNTERKTKAKMLTSAQISDLFRRLDRDGNGELDLEEFLQVSKKLKLEASEEYITGVFKEVDTEKSGTVGLAEFRVAYQKIFTRTSKNLSFSNASKKKSSSSQSDYTEIITATRYGVTTSGEYVFEMYCGYVESLDGHQNFVINERRTFLDDDKQPDPFENFEISNVQMNLVDLNDMILADAKRNKETNANVYWWVDIAMVNVVPYRVDKYIAGFGLPNDTKFRANFGLFNNILPKAEKSHMYPGNGSSDVGPVSSLTIFAQTLWIRNVPLVSCIPEWVDTVTRKALPKKRADGFLDYYKKRFAFFFTTVWSSNKYQQYAAAYNDAEFLAERILDPDTDIDTLEVARVKDWSPMQRVTVAQVGKPQTREPDWLLPSDAIASHPTKIVFDTMSMTLLNHQYGTCACLTIRQIENEGKADLAVSAQARLGVLGRIVTGVRMKIFENVRSKGLSAISGRVNDNPSALLSVLMNCIHNFSMNTLGSLNNWVEIIEQETEDIVVSKLYTHLKEIKRVVKTLKEYVFPSHDLLERLDLDAIEGIAQAKAEELLEEEKDSREEIRDKEKEKVVFTSQMLQPKFSTEHRKSAIFRNLDLSSIVSMSANILSVNKLTGPLTFDILNIFVGGDAIETHKFLEELLEGDATLELKGTKYWKEQITELSEKLDRLKEDMNSGMEEKRSFYSFLLTMVTVVLAPLAIMTGYWGMNFDNMSELHPDTHPNTPGVQLMWVSAFLIYLVFFLFAIHHRILYSAS